MTFSYYPGCTLKSKAKELDISARACAQALGIELKELEQWQCCGACYPMSRDEIATRLAAARALESAQKEGGTLVTLCSACHHVLTRVNGDMKNDAKIADTANRYLELDYHGGTEVLHYLTMLRDRVGFDNLKAKVVNPLKGRKIGAYYGCMLLRPSKAMHFDDPENPTIMEDFIRALGAEPVVYQMRNECCGGYVSMKDEAAAKKNVARVMDNARRCGAQELITACPLCLYNLDKNGGADKLPVHYFTQLLAEALGIKEA